MYMKAPIYELVIGNIPESPGLEESDQDVNWEEVAAVTTRAQEERESQAIKPLIVSLQEWHLRFQHACTGGISTEWPDTGKALENARAESQQ